MRSFINFVILASICFLVSCSTNHRLTRLGVYKELPADEYLKLLEQGNVNIIDVRTQSEYRKSYLKGAINASYMSGKFSEIVSSHHLDSSKLTLIYCETQHRSPLAANKLYKLGFRNIVDLQRGMMYWRKHKFPFEQ
jgi:rhodanese-related sulfurtransferase